MSSLDKLIAVVTFLAVLSQAAQKITDVFKRLSQRLNVESTDSRKEGYRQAILYLMCFFFGGLFSYLSGFTPQAFLAGKELMFEDITLRQNWANPNLIIQSIVVGLAVCFGGNIWNDLLGILREVKKGKEAANALVSPTVLSVNPAQAKAGDAITIHGFGFGAGLGSVKVFFDGVLVPNAPTSWTPNEIKFLVPATIPGRIIATPWPAAGAKVIVTLSVGDLASNPLELQVSP